MARPQLDHYGFTLKCLAYESLQLVQNSGNRILKEFVSCVKQNTYQCMLDRIKLLTILMPLSIHIFLIHV